MLTQYTYNVFESLMFYFVLKIEGALNTGFKYWIFSHLIKNNQS